MATGPRKPFVRRGITFSSQYAYRQFLAAERGFATPAARNKAIAAQKRLVSRYPGGLSKEEQGVLAAGLADYQGRIGSHIHGASPETRGSSRLPRELQLLIRRMGADQYPIWRALYK